MLLRSPLRRPVARSLFAANASRNVTRSIPPDPEPREEQPSTESQPPRPEAETVASHSPHSTSELQNRVRRWTDKTAIAVRTRADEFTSTTKTTFSQLGLHLNKMTGYEEIEALKRRVVEQETLINEARDAARAAKTAYDMAVVQRSNSQRDINDLLQRKSTWNQADIARFTTLIPQDHEFEQRETQARAAVHDAEEAVEREFTELMRTILARYHEEQVWSDKIRSASTYGSLTVLGLNLLVFVVAIVFVEPWKRRRLARTFEKKIEEMGMENKAVVEESMAEIGRKLETQAQLLLHAAPASAGASPAIEAPPAAATGSPRVIFGKSQDREIGATVAGTALVAGVFGWFLKSWLGG
ncbi:Mdm33 family-domain-containing protein [Mycena filopes]|nr:Mdm33 family-domain-containing protein [Mycena filopes]